MRNLRRFITFKILSLMLVGTAVGQIDKVEAFVVAIAKAEGAYSKGSIPNRYRNPCDLKGNGYAGQRGIGKAGHVIFRNDAAGWDACRNQVERMVDGTSRFYKQEMTLRQVARRYAADRRWVTNVSHVLGVSPDTTIEQYFDIPPRLVERDNKFPDLWRTNAETVSFASESSEPLE